MTGKSWEYGNFCLLWDNLPAWSLAQNDFEWDDPKKVPYAKIMASRQCGSFYLGLKGASGKRSSPREICHQSRVLTTETVGTYFCGADIFENRTIIRYMHFELCLRWWYGKVTYRVPSDGLKPICPLPAARISSGGQRRAALQREHVRPLFVIRTPLHLTITIGLLT